MGKTERLAKFIASCGYCSRRSAESLILQKRVKVNGTIVTTPVTFVMQSDDITIDEEKISKQENIRLWMYYKSKSLITSHYDPEGRITVFSTLPKEMQKVISVGRLDYSTEGLLLLTNNGKLARNLELPSTGLIRKYRCRLFGKLSEQNIAQLAAGIVIDGIQYRSISISIKQNQNQNYWADICLREGKNREIKKVLAYFGVQVSRLIRIGYGPFELGDMKDGQIRELCFSDFQIYLK